MKFEVNRASSGLLQREKPCQEASLAILTYTIQGTSGATLEDKRTVWVVVIRNLKELLKFIEKYDPIVIDRSDIKELDYTITIQDEPF